MFSFETLIYSCLMFIVPLHCCQNLTLPNVPTRRLLPGNPTTAASATVWGLSSGLSQTVTFSVVQQWLLRARNWITCTVIIERSNHSLVTHWGLKFCWWLFTTFWYVISKKRKQPCFFEIWKNEKYVFSNTGWDCQGCSLVLDWGGACPPHFCPRVFLPLRLMQINWV